MKLLKITPVPPKDNTQNKTCILLVVLLERPGSWHPRNKERLWCTG
jgi:hypothetical protein